MGRAFGAVPLNLNETLARGDFAGALALIRPLLTARPEDPVLLRLAGHCLARVGRHDESEHHWKQAAQSCRAAQKPRAAWANFAWTKAISRLH